MTHESASGEYEVGTGCVESLVDQEVFLLPSEVGDHMLDIGVEVACYGSARLVDGGEGAQQRGLVVKRLACVGDEYCGDTESVVDDKGGRRDVPGRIAAGLESVTYAAVGET